MAPHIHADGSIETPNGAKDPHAHRHHGFLHRFAHIMRTTVKIAFVPILIGVAFGMAASAIGMLIGQLVVFVWMRYRRNDGPAYEPLDSDEKEVPPPYEDVPIPEALNEKEIEAKA